jgi:hypothetical protein
VRAGRRASDTGNGHRRAAAVQAELLRRFKDPKAAALGGIGLESPRRIESGQAKSITDLGEQEGLIPSGCPPWPPDLGTDPPETTSYTTPLNTIAPAAQAAAYREAGAPVPRAILFRLAASCKVSVVKHP